MFSFTKWKGFLSLLLILLLTFSIGFAQNSPEAGKAYEKAKKLEQKDKFPKMFEAMIEAITLETKLEDGQDREFVGDIYFHYARYFIGKEHFGSASQFFFLSALNYQLGGHTAKAQSTFQQVAFFEDSARLHQSNYVFSFKNTDKEYTRYPISSIVKTAGDTTWFTMNMGKRDSLTIGQSGWFLSIYDDQIPERYVEALGATTLVSMEFGRSLWYMVMSDDGKTSGFVPQLGDLNYLQVASNPESLDGLVEQLTKYHTLFLSDYNKPFYSYDIGQQIAGPKSEGAIIAAMRDVIVSTATLIYDPETSDHTELLDSGAFKGYNMWEAMKMTTTSDVRAYLRYVIDNPHGYMGQEFRIDEYYASWILKFTPASDDDHNVYWSSYRAVSTTEEWDDWKKDHAKYLKLSSFDFSKVDSFIYTISASQGNDSALKLVSQWLDLTKDYEYKVAHRGL
jgi:hypothetical protein